MVFIKYDKNDKFLDWLKELAKKKRENAAYSGSSYDDGARALEREISVFEDGINGVYPVIWASQYEAFSKENDPDYSEYLRLKEKFKE